MTASISRYIKGGSIRQEFRRRIAALASESEERDAGCDIRLRQANVYLGRPFDGHSARYYLDEAADDCTDPALKRRIEELRDALLDALYGDDCTRWSFDLWTRKRAERRNRENLSTP